MSHLQLDMWQSEGTSPLDPNLVQIWLGERKGRGGVDGEREKSFRERNSHFSLLFLAIGPSNLGETRDKVDPHCKSYAWVSVLWSFGNSGR